jgi:hypothetical protein
MPGYSGTPLVKKLGIKENFRVAFHNLPPDVKAELQVSLASCKSAPTQLDFAMIFVQSQTELKKEFPRHAGRLAPTGMLWVSWPKKSSKVATDLDDNIVREIGLANLLVDVKVCAVSEVWSGLKFVIRVKDRFK